MFRKKISKGTKVVDIQNALRDIKSIDKSIEKLKDYRNMLCPLIKSENDLSYTTEGWVAINQRHNYELNNAISDRIDKLIKQKNEIEIEDNE